MTRRSVALALVIGGCAVEEEPAPLAANFLRLQAWVVAGPEGAEGYLRWLYVADDPAVTAEPREFCDLWEYLDLPLAPAADPACVGCEALFEGTAVIDADRDTCADATWGERTFRLGFAPIAGSEVESSALVDAGFTHAAATSWSPDLGETQGFQWLFAGEPQAWTSAEAPLGTPSGQAPAGEYHLYGVHYWDVRE